MGQCHRSGPLGKRDVEGSIQMQLHQTDTTDTASIQELPMLNEMRFFRNRQLSLQGPEYTAEHLSIRIDGGIIAGKVDIHAAARQLRIDFAKRAHLIRSYQDVTDPSGILEMFEVI